MYQMKWHSNQYKQHKKQRIPCSTSNVKVKSRSILSINPWSADGINWNLAGISALNTPASKHSTWPPYWKVDRQDDWLINDR